jgi:hypothetical protein
MTLCKKTAFLLGLVVLGGVLVGLPLLLLRLVGLPSELSTLALAGVLLLIIAIASVGIGIVLHFFDSKPEHLRLAIAGVGLLSVGCAAAFGLLPEHAANRTASGAEAIGVLPPSPGEREGGFELGLAAQPQGCSESVPIKLVINGSPAYWTEHPSRAGTWLHFVVVLPGSVRHEGLEIGLGREDTNPLADPQQANMDRSGDVANYLRQGQPVYSRRRDLTVLSGEVKDWPQTQRPVVITADANWISRRGVNDCNLQLPALVGPPTALAVVEALTCHGLDRNYLAGTCADPGAVSGTKSTTVSPGIEVNEAVAMVAGSNVSTSESVPQPVQVDEMPGWKCRAPQSSALPRIRGRGEAGSGTASASVSSGNECHAIATLQASTWHRDFLLALIGALVAVGVHMMFQGMVEGHREAA